MIPWWKKKSIQPKLDHIEDCARRSTCVVSRSRPTGPALFLKNNSAATGNFEVGGIPFSGEPSNAGSLLETHSHPLRQTLINLCAQVWISRLNLWHAALPERYHLQVLPPPTPLLLSQTKTRLATLPLSSLLLWLVSGVRGVSQPLKGPFSKPKSSTFGAFRPEAKGQLVVCL